MLIQRQKLRVTLYKSLDMNRAANPSLLSTLLKKHYPYIRKKVLPILLLFEASDCPRGKIVFDHEFNTLSNVPRSLVSFFS